MKTILVTGGAGFLGSHTCERLLKDGHEVIALDDLSTGSRTNIAHLMHNSRFRFVVHDVTTPFELQVEWIFHLACPASPVQYQKNPIRMV
jgi:UDP-glucuronate decarboxylase